MTLAKVLIANRGEIAKVHHENGQPVQYGEVLFSIRPDR